MNILSEDQQSPCDIMSFEKLLQAVALHYTEDPTTAGIVSAYVPDMKKFYCSVVRYEKVFGKKKYVVVSAYGDNLEDAVINTAKLWLQSINQAL